ncbi:MAG: hypothetical protein ACK46Q_10580 [Hyphomonas sp.]
MLRPVRTSLPLLALLLLAACHTDPFGLKPEVRGVEIPDRTATDSTAPEAGEETSPDEE